MKEITFSTPGGYDFEPPVPGMPDPNNGLSLFENIIKWGITVTLIAAVLLTLFFFIWGGIQWITSGGEKEKVAGARKKITYAAIGLIITLLSFFIVNFVGGLFGVDFFT